MVRFQLFLTNEQHAFLRKHAYETGMSGGLTLRKGLRLFAKNKGVDLPATLTPRSIREVTLK